MFKLIIYICSPVIGSCYPDAIIMQDYNNLFDCTIQGYSESIVLLNEIGKELIEEKELFTKFICKSYEHI